MQLGHLAYERYDLHDTLNHIWEETKNQQETTEWIEYQWNICTVIQGDWVVLEIGMHTYQMSTYNNNAPQHSC